MFNLFIEPYVFACPDIEQGKAEYDKFIYNLIGWQNLNNSDWLRVFILENSSQILFETNKYPLWDDLSKAINTFKIDYISPDAVMKLVNSFLEKFLMIEVYMGITKCNHDQNICSPDYNLPYRHQSFQESQHDIGAKMILFFENEYCRIDSIALATTGLKEHSITFTSNFNESTYLAGYKSTFTCPPAQKVSHTFSIFYDYESLKSKKCIELIKSAIKANQKQIKLSGDHHGNNVLEQFAKKIFKSPYVVEIINNLPFKGKTNDFIRNVYGNGQIDITLTDTDEGFGMAIQTTGRNLNETEVIAKILERDFKSKQ